MEGRFPLDLTSVFTLTEALAFLVLAWADDVAEVKTVLSAFYSATGDPLS